MRPSLSSMLIFAFLLSILVVGCVESENLPPNTYSHRMDGLEGNFYETDKETGVRTDVAVRYDSERACYVASSPERKGEPKIYLRKFDDVVVGFIQIPDQKAYNIVRVRTSRTQVVLEMIDHKYFKENMGALPKTSESEGTVTLGASPDQLALFFKLHGSNDKIWGTREPVVYNRAGT